MGEGTIGHKGFDRRNITWRIRLARRKVHSLCVALVAVTVLMAACQQAAGHAPGSSSSGASGGAAAKAPDWKRLAADAYKEGAVNVYGGLPSAGLRETLTGPFEKAYPGIKVKGTFAPATDLVSRLLAERQASKYIADVVVGPATQSVLTLKPAGVLAPLKPALILPEVADPSLWLQKKLWWMDAQEPFTTLKFQGYVSTDISYNNTLVDPKQFTSYYNLLDPKWKGKIVASDIRRAGPGSLQVRFVLTTPSLGPAFLERLFSEMSLILASDQHQMVDWMGQGRYPVGLWLADTELKAAASQGVPVGIVPGDQLKEGSLLGSGGGTVNLADSGPHPNAAKVFINWLLSKEGQIIYQENVRQPSLRVDVPRGDLDPMSIPRPDVNYVDSYNEEMFRRVSAQDITNLVDKALQKTT